MAGSLSRSLADRPAAATLDRTQGRGRLRRLHRRYDHAARNRESDSASIGVLPSESRPHICGAGAEMSIDTRETGARQALLVLALCPALAVSDTVANALGLGATALLASFVTTVTA